MKKEQDLNYNKSGIVNDSFVVDENLSGTTPGQKIALPEKDGGDHGITHQTSYFGATVHLLKGNIGGGCLAMGDAFKNAGLLVGSVVTILLGIVCLHSQRLLVNCSKFAKDRFNLDKCPGYAETVQYSFESGPERLRKWSNLMKITVNIFLCLTQLGFCCVYIVFVSDSLKQVMDHYDVHLSSRVYMAFLLVPIILTCLITNLKLLVPVSTTATICMAVSILMVLGYSMQGLPAISERKAFATVGQFPLYFGTAIFGFEAIALVLPIRNSMKKPESFDSTFGVLNVGTSIVICCYTVVGLFGYWRYGEDIKGSITLNLPDGEIFSQSVKIIALVGILLGYCLQFYVPVEVMWPSIIQRYNLTGNLHLKELVFRLFLVMVTFVIAELIPNLGILISLIGAFCSSALALMYPPLIDLIIRLAGHEKANTFIIIKNILIFLLGFFGFLTGTYASFHEIFKGSE